MDMCGKRYTRAYHWAVHGLDFEGPEVLRIDCRCFELVFDSQGARIGTRLDTKVSQRTARSTSDGCIPPFLQLPRCQNLQIAMLLHPVAKCILEVPISANPHRWSGCTPPTKQLFVSRCFRKSLSLIIRI